MTTATPTKQEVKTTWPVTKIQEESAAAMVRNMRLTFQVLEKAGPEVLKNWYQAFTQMRIEYFQAKNVKTPLELVKAMAEFDANVFGSEIRVWGDDKQAHLEYVTCGVFNCMQKQGIPQAELEKMGKNCAETTQHFAAAFGFTGEIKKPMNPGEMMQITFVRK
jgi:hypothetical protein